MSEAVREALERLERKVDALLRRQATAKRAGRKRRGSVAERVAADVRYRPTELQMARARKALGSR